MTRVLITGVAGFIGSNVAAELLAKGYHVVGVDNMSQGDKLNMAGFIDHPEFEIHYVDIRDEAAVKAAAKGCKKFLHLAAFKIPRYIEYRLQDFERTPSMRVQKQALIKERADLIAGSWDRETGKIR